MIRIAKQLIPIDVLCPRDPRSRQKDARFQPRMIPASVNPAKDVRTHPPTVLSVIALVINLLFFLSQKAYPPFFA